VSRHTLILLPPQQLTPVPEELHTVLTEVQALSRAIRVVLLWKRAKVPTLHYVLTKLYPVHVLLCSTAVQMHLLVSIIEKVVHCAVCLCYSSRLHKDIRSASYSYLLEARSFGYTHSDIQTARYT
jgi:hypothetical protein